MKYAIALAAFSWLFLASCEDEKPRAVSSKSDDPKSIKNFVASSSITPVLPSTPEEFKLRGSHARLLRTAQGTRIHVPSNAFVNKGTGDPIEGDVILIFNEYHSQGDILGSGIPMRYVTLNGDTAHFESGGLFEVRAFQEGIELELAVDKEIEVELATEINGAFDFYAFNESQESWGLKDTTCVPIPNPYIPKQIIELEKLDKEMPETPKTLIEHKIGDPLFDVKRYGTDEEELESLDGVFWKFTGDSTQIDPSQNNVAFNKKYDFVELAAVDSSEVREYTITFRNATEEIVVRAAPIFQGKLLARENDRMARISSQIDYASKAKAQIEEELDKEKSLMRMIKINKMGIHNYGRQLQMDEAIPFLADFTFESEELNQALTVYMLPVEKNAVIRYTPTTFDQFKIVPSESNHFVVILPNRMVYALSSDDVKRMRISRKKAGSELVFDLKKYEALIQGPSDVDTLLAHF
ncbi:MAG: hypothetical protein AB8B56_13935 [Crocinitomicaceae bacterium]